VVLDWNQALLGAIGATGTSAPAASRSLAIVHAAIYDAVNAVDRSHAPYFVDAAAAPGTSREAAAAAAYRASVSLFPTQTARFDAALARSLDGIPVGLGLIDGIVLGSSVANAVLDWRRGDGSDRVVTYTPGSNPGDWQPTPPAFAAPAVPQWPGVTPFTMTSGDQFRPEGPPALTSREYTAAFNEVKELGALNSTVRSAEGTEIARFWADLTVPGGAAGHWNQIAAGVSECGGPHNVPSGSLLLSGPPRTRPGSSRVRGGCRCRADVRESCAERGTVARGAEARGARAAGGCAGLG
jgi:hypothetical protein